MNSRPSISDIARETGVSAATVSLALRDKGRISAATRARVKAAAAASGYVPNSNARSLVGGKTQLITISLPAISLFPEAMSSVRYFFRILGAVTSKALEMDYGLLVTAPTDRPGRVAADGAIVVDPSVGDQTITTFDRLGLPVVTIGRRVDGSVPAHVRALAVDNDYLVATEQVLEHLTEAGSGSVALIASKPIDSFQRDSIDAYETWCEVRGIAPRVVVSESPDLADAAVAARKVLEGPERPDAVYTTIDLLASSLLEAARAESVEVPADLRIATCSDSHIARASDPPLTTIDERPVELGRAAVELLVGEILDPGSGPGFIQVETELIVRGSTV